MFSIEKTLHKQVEVSDVETLLEGEEIRLYVLGYLQEKVLEDEEIREMLEDYSDLKMTPTRLLKQLIYLSTSNLFS